MCHICLCYITCLYKVCGKATNHVIAWLASYPSSVSPKILLCSPTIQESLDIIKDELSRVAPTLQSYAQLNQRQSVSFAQDSPDSPLTVQAFLSQLEYTEDGELRVIHTSDTASSHLGMVTYYIYAHYMLFSFWHHTWKLSDICVYIISFFHLIPRECVSVCPDVASIGCITDQFSF